MDAFLLWLKFHSFSCLGVSCAFARPRAVCRRLPVAQHVCAARWLQRL